MQKNAGVEMEEALLVAENASVDDVRHTVDGDLLENMAEHGSCRDRAPLARGELKQLIGSWPLELEQVYWRGCRARDPRDFVPQISFGCSSTAPQVRDFLLFPLALISSHLAGSLDRKLGSLWRRAALDVTSVSSTELFFSIRSWTGHQVTDQLVTAVNQSQREAVELGMTESIFALEGCRTPLASFYL